jgi:hypothetical protein
MKETNLSRQQKVIDKLDRVIEVLSGPIPEKEKEHGWNEASRLGFLKIFKNIRDNLGRFTWRNDSCNAFGTMGRVLDISGIRGGKIEEMIFDALHAYNEYTSGWGCALVLLLL